MSNSPWAIRSYYIDSVNSTDLLAAYRLKCLELGIPVLESDSSDRVEVREENWEQTHGGAQYATVGEFSSLEKQLGGWVGPSGARR